MEFSSIKSPNAKRFVIEDSITKVTSDGEPHEMMTMIAGLSGVLAAIVILTVLIFIVACKKSTNKHECDRCSESGSCATQGKRSSAISDDLADAQSKCSSTATIFDKNAARLNSVSIIFNGGGGNLHQNLNKAFEGSELSLQSALERPKKQKRTHWQDEMVVQERESNTNATTTTTTNTTIDMERF